MVDNNHSVDAMFLIHVETVDEYFKLVHIDQSAVSPEGVKRRVPRLCYCLSVLLIGSNVSS